MTAISSNTQQVHRGWNAGALEAACGAGFRILGEISTELAGGPIATVELAMAEAVTSLALNGRPTEGDNQSLRTALKVSLGIAAIYFSGGTALALSVAGAFL